MLGDIQTSPNTWMTNTYQEIQDVAEQAGSVLVLPIGSIEQHGHHLPVGTDTILATNVVRLGAERVRDDVPLLTLPPVWAGYSPHHMAFGGTITTEFRDLQRYIENIADAGVKNGFDALLLVNGHGGNTALINGTVSTIGTSHPQVEVFGVTYFALAASFIDEIRESRSGGMAHGGEFETSLMMHLHPDLVTTDAMQETYREETFDHAGREMFDGGPLTKYKPFDEYSDTGAIGDPVKATEEKGAEIFDRLGNEMEKLIHQIHQECR